MIYHVNGWSFIAAHLKRRNLRQRDLAELLQISPAAISQAKSGRSLFNSSQLSAIADFLSFDASTKRRFYRELFAARMGEDAALCQQDPPGSRSPCGRVPCCPLPLLLDYAPAAEGLREFVEAHQTETLPAEDLAGGCVAVRTGLGAQIGLPPGSVLALPERPSLLVDRCTVLGCSRQGLFVARICRDRQEGVISFHQLSDLARKIEPWHYCREPGGIRFLLPVLTLKLSC